MHTPPMPNHNQRFRVWLSHYTEPEQWLLYEGPAWYWLTTASLPQEAWPVGMGQAPDKLHLWVITSDYDGQHLHLNSDWFVFVEATPAEPVEDTMLVVRTTKTARRNTGGILHASTDPFEVSHATCDKLPARWPPRLLYPGDSGKWMLWFTPYSLEAESVPVANIEAPLVRKPLRLVAA